MFANRISLRLRLALIFAVGSLATLLVVTGALYLAFRQEIRSRNHLLLDAKVQEIATLLERNPNERESLEEELTSESDQVHPTQLWLRVLKGADTLLETYRMADNLPPDWISSQKHEHVRKNHERYLLVETRVGDYRIQGALDVTRDEHLVDSYWKRLVYAMILAAAGCAVLGWWAAHSGLRPLRDIATSTGRIRAHRSQERLDLGAVPPELGDLVKALNAMLDRLNQAYERLARFSSDLAHELRTPISNLMGETEVMLSKDRNDEEYRQVLESSLEEHRRLSRLISRMLFLARAEDPSAVIEKSPVEGEKLVEDLLGYFEAMAEELGIRLEGEGSGRFMADPDMVRQALANLVSNALDATPEGGHVSLRVSVVENEAILEVRDTGRGVGKEELPRILDRFYRTRDALDQHRPGVGLGLAIVQSIARLHGGSLLIQSEPGHGTSAILQVPA